MDPTTQKTQINRQLIANQIARKKNMKKQKQRGSITNQEYHQSLQMDKHMLKQMYQSRQQDSLYHEDFFTNSPQQQQNYTMKQNEPNQYWRFKNYAENTEKSLYRQINRSTFNWKIFYLQLKNNIYTKTRQAKITSNPPNENYSYSQTVKTQDRYAIFGISARLLMIGVYDFTVLQTQRKYLTQSQLRKYVIKFEGAPMAVRSELVGVTVLGHNVFAVKILQTSEKREGVRQSFDKFKSQFSNKLVLNKMEKLGQDSGYNLYIIKTLKNLKQIIYRARKIFGSNHKEIKIIPFPRHIIVQNKSPLSSEQLSANIRASIQLEDIRRSVRLPNRLVIQFEDHHECIRAYNQLKQYGDIIQITLADEQQELISLSDPWDILLIKYLKLKL